MDSAKAFDELVRNAFEFIDSSIENYKTRPKFAVIDFCSAVELFYKARLMKEHWSLILEDVGRANLEKFVQGKFESVGILAANERLKSICNDGVGSAELDCFNKLRQHRNKMVHFFHESQRDTKQLEQVAGELCRAWYFLSKTIKVQWQVHFGSFAEQMDQVDKKMHGQREFLRKKFLLLKGTLAEKKNEGLLIQKCPACRLKGMVVKVDELVFWRECQVCNLSDWGVKCVCPDCESMQWIVGDAWFPCRTARCEHVFSDAELAESLTYDLNAPGDVEIPSEAACSNCDGVDSAIHLENDKWLCTHCFELHEDMEVGQCGWCSGYCIDIPDDSFIVGCPACDGHSGWTKND